MTSNLFTLPDGSNFPIITPLVGYRDKMERQLKRFPFEKNVFLMMRFRPANKGLSDFIIKTLKEAGLNGIRADHWSITSNVYNAIAVLYCCKYGIALFDKAEANQAYNPNVLYELGMMHCLERECLILKNDRMPAIPFDLIKDIYMPYKDRDTVQTNILRWLKRILPEEAKSLPSTTSKGQSRLGQAAVAAPIRQARKASRSAVVDSPDKLGSAKFTWRIVPKTKKESAVWWSIKLTNKGKKSTRVKVKVLFLDEDGFALEHYTGSTAKTILPGRKLFHKETLMLSSDLAKRIKRAMATVSTVR